MLKKLLPFMGLFAISLAFCSPPGGNAMAQAIPTTQPTIVATSVPTSVPTTIPSQQPAYIIPGLPELVIGTPPPLHVMTADYYPTASLVNQCNTVSQFTTYVYPSSASQSPILHNCGEKVIAYINPSMPQKNEDGYPLITTDNSEAKDCSGNNVTTYAGNGLLLDPHSANAVTYYQAVLDARVSEFGGINNIDGFYSDNTGSIYGSNANPCDWTGYTDWLSSTESDLSKVNTHGAQLFLNSLSLPEAYASPPADDTVQNVVSTSLAAPVTGAQLEGFIFDDYPNRPQWWTTTLNTEILQVNNKKVFWAYSNHHLANIDPSSAIGMQWRNYLFASFLLAYDPRYSIFQEWFTTPSGSRVMPETGLVPTLPVQTPSSSISELQDSTGLATRQFAKCYFRGVPLGPCLVAVNPTASTLTVSQPNYMHSMILHGSGIMDGGTVSFDGPQVTSLGAYSGAILFQ